MIKNSSKLIFFSILVFSTIIIMSSSSWFNTWMGLEINLISFISLILINKKSFSIEASIIYFIIQAIASIMFLYAMIFYMFNITLNFTMYNFYNKMILIALLMKIGTAPLHFWMPLVMEGLTWMNNYLLMTWQKLGPLILILNNLNLKFLTPFIIISSIMGSLGGLNQTSLKKMMTFSSINQISWLLIALITNKILWKIYYSFYFLISLNLIIIFNFFNLINLSQLFNLNKFNLSIMMFIFFNILSMGGLPPFLGFFPKMMIILTLSNNFMMFTLILFTLITLFFYLRLMYFTLFLNNFKLNKINNFNFKKIKILMYLSYFMNFSLLIFIFL